ncbi:MAG TPA: hypothetical protein VFJ12_11055 [Segeticoccus sp.]|nr:hypothetical protein [Segeticoccus sp.]
MAEQRWTPADDEALRAQLALLRREVDDQPLPDVRFVKARGRRRHRRLVAGAAAVAAAAVVAVGYVGVRGLLPDDHALVPAHPSVSAPRAVSPTPARPEASGARSATAPPRASGTTSSPTAASTEPMEVVGPRPLLSSSLFVPASRWSSPGLTEGHPTSDMAGDWEGSADIALCDVDTAMDGSPRAGRFGIVTVRDDTTGTAVGKQRIRLFDSVAQARAERDRLVEGIRTCPGRMPGVTVTPAAGAAPTTFRVDFDNPNGGPVITEWVDVAVQTTRPAVSTVVLNGGTVNPALQDGFAELRRLRALATS